MSRRFMSINLAKPMETVDPTAPADARCRKNVVVRSFVFF
jgi:hypothetical protein